MSLPREARRLPVLAVSLGLEAWERTRGPREFALRRVDEILQIAAHTPLGRLLPQQMRASRSSPWLWPDDDGRRSAGSPSDGCSAASRWPPP